MPETTGRWICAGVPGDYSQVYPENDLIAHDTEGPSDDCVCGPNVEYVEGGGRVITHHSLDGRELKETQCH